MLLWSRVQDRRQELMLSQEDIATFIGVRVQTIDNWERGISSPKKTNLQALAKVLQTTTDYLEGNTDIATDYASGENTCIICGKPIPYGAAKCPECCWNSWPSSFIHSEEQAARRKRSHSLILASLDKEKGRATFISPSSYRTEPYVTTLDRCTCPDFEDRHMPCKHIFRLASELGFFQSEEFASCEKDYTMNFAPNADAPTQLTAEVYHDEHDEMAESPSVVPDVIENLPAVAVLPTKGNSGAGIFSKLLKYICCCFFGFIALICIVGAFTQGKEWLCFPAGLAVAGLLTANVAKRHALGSAFKWGVYGALVPVASWIDVVMAHSESKPKGFLKGIAYSFCGLAVFLAIFSSFLPPVQPKEVSAQTVPTVSVEAPATEIKAAVLPANAESNLAISAPSAPKPKPAASRTKKPEPETISVYLGENRVILDPNDDEEQAPRAHRGVKAPNRR